MAVPASSEPSEPGEPGEPEEPAECAYGASAYAAADGYDTSACTAADVVHMVKRLPPKARRTSISLPRGPRGVSDQVGEPDAVTQQANLVMPTFEEEKGEPEQRGWLDPFGYFSSFYNGLWQAIIRPPRSRYTTESLGPVKFRLNLPRMGMGGAVVQRTFVRKDLRLKNARGLVLECSHFMPFSDQGSRKRPCVIYLHGNSSCRMESYAVMPLILRYDLSLFALDFAGSGLSGGSYVSLGHFEEQDLRLVIDHLHAEGTVSSIGLWGRSMGAVTAILRSAADSSITACVLDSPFANFQTLVYDVAQAHSEKLPRWVVEMCLGMACKEVKERAGFDPRCLVPLERAASCKCPALFGVAAEDTLVLPERTQAVCNAWRGESRLRTFAGSHGSRRPHWFMAEGARFLAEKLYVADEVEAQLVLASDAYFNSEECREFRKIAQRRQAVQRVLESDKLGAAVDAYMSCAEMGSAIDTYIAEGASRFSRRCQSR